MRKKKMRNGEKRGAANHRAEMQEKRNFRTGVADGESPGDDSRGSIGFSLAIGQGTTASIGGNCEISGSFNSRYFPDLAQETKRLINLVP
jgi:hypothetical protein